MARHARSGDQNVQCRGGSQKYLLDMEFDNWARAGLPFLYTKSMHQFSRAQSRSALSLAASIRGLVSFLAVDSARPANDTSQPTSATVADRDPALVTGTASHQNHSSPSVRAARRRRSCSARLKHVTPFRPIISPVDTSHSLENGRSNLQEEKVCR